MSASQEQCFLDVISRETKKLMNLRNTFNLEQEKLHHERKVKGRSPFYVHDDTADKERRERLNFQLEIEREAEEKKSLLEAAIREAASSGFPFPPSFVKLMESQNGKIMKKKTIITYLYTYISYPRYIDVHEAKHEGIQYNHPICQTRNKGDKRKCCPN